MSVRLLLRRYVPEPVKAALRPIRNRFVTKHGSELAFWKRRHAAGSGRFGNAHYQRLMLGMAEETCGEFLRGKVVADFGCGPRGSLVWASEVQIRIGIDVLADQYADAFTQDIQSHGMIYLKSTEKTIPLPNDFVDVMFTLNAMDHVDSFPIACDEVLRVLKPGGEFVGSFNLEEPRTPCEPQCLSEELIKQHLLNHMQIRSCRVTAKGPAGDQYAPFFEGPLTYSPGEQGYLWVRASKLGNS